MRGGAGDEHTQDSNVTALRRYGLVPRMLRDRTVRDMSTSFLGRTFTSPAFICPVGVLGAVRDRGDLLTAAAARELDMPAMYSTLSRPPWKRSPLRAVIPMGSSSCTRRRIQN